MIWDGEHGSRFAKLKGAEIGTCSPSKIFKTNIQARGNKDSKGWDRFKIHISDKILLGLVKVM